MENKEFKRKTRIGFEQVVPQTTTIKEVLNIGNNQFYVRRDSTLFKYYMGFTAH